MNPGFFRSGRDALMLALQKNDLTQLRNTLAPKTLYRLVLSGDGWIQSDALDALFEQSTAEARAFQKFILATWIKNPESPIIPDNDKVKSYLPTMPMLEQALALAAMTKKKGLSYFITDWSTASHWLFPCLHDFQQKLLFSSLLDEIMYLAEDAIQSTPPEKCKSKWLLNDIIELLYFKEDEQLLTAISTALKKAPLLLATCSSKNIHALTTLLSDEDKFLIVDELLALLFLKADLADYKKFDLKQLNKALSPFLESMSDEKRTLCFDKHAAYFLNNYAGNDQDWKPFPNQFIITALPYFDKASINQLTSDFLSYFKKGAKLSHKHAELGLRLMPYLDKSSLDFIASHYLCPGNLSRKQHHRAWAFLSVRIPSRCLELVDAWIKEKGFKDCLKNFFFDFSFPLPEEKKQAYFQHLCNCLRKEEGAIPINETEAYARLLNLWSMPDAHANQKMVCEGLKKILFTPSATGEESLRPEARFICEAFCNATTPNTSLPISIVELLKEHGLDLDEPLTPCLILPDPDELLRTIPLKERCEVSNMLHAWDQHLHNYLHHKETAIEAISPLLEWANMSNSFSQHQNLNLQHTSQMAFQLGLKLLNSYLLSCSLEQLIPMQQLIDTGLSIYPPHSEEFDRNYAEIDRLNCLSWITTFSQDCMQPEPKSWCTIL